jgi:cytochrome c553
MRESETFGWPNPVVRWSVLALLGLTIASLLVGFVWLPSVHGDYGAQGLWASICRAAGVPADWSTGAKVQQGPTATDVVLERSMASDGASDAIGRGATLALNCTMCHGAQGMSQSNAPNLAGQYPEVVMKQLHDYKGAKRSSPIMQALAARLSDRDIADLAAFYAYLPKARTAPTTYDESLPTLVRVGAPLRNVAPCVACHGGIDQKLGAPWIEGMPRDYIVQQLKAFRGGTRRNDAEEQMRNVARSMTDREMDEVALFYARKASPGGAR